MLIQYGDLFTSTAPALAHGVNVDGVMGAGIAVAFRKKFKGLYPAYRDQCRSGALRPGGMFPYKAADGRWVYNMASQDRPGPHARVAWIISAAHLALDHADAHDIPLVALPRIGSNIGGLEWTEVALALEDVERDHAANFEAWIFPSTGLGKLR